MSKSEKALEKLIEKLFYAKCSGIPVPIMKIGSIFAHAKAIVAQEPGISEEALGEAIHEYVLVIA